MSATGIRARNRAAMMQAIMRTANAQLVEVGPGQLSVRAVARELDMASSAIYRYVRSRDELLTLLIVGAYDDMGDFVQARTHRVQDPRKRWMAVGLSCREWALAQPQRFALIYGSPVPGYAAPQDTIGPATRIPALLVGILQGSRARPDVPAFSARVARSLRPALAGLPEWSALSEPDFVRDLRPPAQRGRGCRNRPPRVLRVRTRRPGRSAGVGLMSTAWSAVTAPVPVW